MINIKELAYILSENGVCIDGRISVKNIASEVEALVTRAVPDVPELVRYRPAVYMEPCLGGMFNDEFGEYVLHSQAAAIIAAKDGDIALKDTGLKIAMTKIAALEAKLAQYEAQEPVATVELRVLNGRRVKHIYPINLENVEAGSTLYASPAPSADLKAENERLRKALSEIAGYTYDDTAERVALEALKETNHDKG